MVSIPTEPMNEGRFWALIEQCQGDANKLKTLLMRLSQAEIIAFDLRLDSALYQLDRADIHEITDGSDDGFEYVRLWIVSKGRTYFESVLENPDLAPHDAHDEENEELGYAAAEAYQQKYGEPMPTLDSSYHRATGSNAAGWPRRE